MKYIPLIFLLFGCSQQVITQPVYIPIVEYSAGQNANLAAIMEQNPEVIPYIRDYADLRSMIKANNSLKL